MKGGLTTEGFLYLARTRRGKPSLEGQACPFSSTHPQEPGMAMCGDWCPHFGEPKRLDGYDRGVTVELIISCGNGRRILFEEFDDKRMDAPAVPTEKK